MTQSADNRWLFDLNRLKNSPSKRDGIGYNEEMSLRQRGTGLIREMAQYLKLNSIVMQTAMVYYHRFFALRSFAKFDPHRMALCALYLASKWDEQPILREHLINLACVLRPKVFVKESYAKDSAILIDNEAEMLLTFGFNLSVTHFHPLIAQDSPEMSVIPKIIRKNAYIIASDLLRLTTLCLQFRPHFIACICLHLASTSIDQPLSPDWCRAIDPDIKLSDVQREAEAFRKTINLEHLSLDHNKKPRIQSQIARTADTDSAYSSSGESPNLDAEKPKTPKVESVPKSVHKLIAVEHQSRKRQKVIDSNGEVTRLAMPPTIAQKMSDGHHQHNRKAVQPPTKVTSAAAAVASAQPSINCKKPLNLNSLKSLRITFSTDVSTKSSAITDSAKRVVSSEHLVNSRTSCRQVN